MAGSKEGRYAFLAGGGEMGALMRAHDWSRSPLGDPAGWPDALKLSVSICLNSRFPILLWWGPALVTLYNDAWRPVAGTTKHPSGFARPGKESWADIWDVIGPQLQGVLERGEATWSKDVQLFLNRYEYTEETYFTYAYSPIHEADGRIGGVFSAVYETTTQVLGARRLELLREIGAVAAVPRETPAMCVSIAEVLRRAPDIAFATIHVTAAEGGLTRLAATHPEALADLATVSAAGPDAWGLRAVMNDGRVAVEHDLGARARVLPDGRWPEPVIEAAKLPLFHPGAHDRASGVLTVGLSPRRRLDADYLGFLELVARHVAGAIAGSEAFEAERRRAEGMAALARAKTEFFSNVSHEFRTPLTLMLGPLEDALAARDGLPPEHAERLDIVHRNGLRLLRLVNGLLDFSRAEAGRMQARFEPTDLAALTAQLAESFRPACDRAGLELAVAGAALPAPVFIDRPMWETVVLNLLSNAFKFTLAGKISVRVAAADGQALLEVADTGVGIPPSELPRLFERFHRVQGTRGRSFEGSGIGLALVRDLVALHGGSVAVESREGEGSVFRVLVPFGAAHLPAERVREAAAAPAAADMAEAFISEALRWMPEPAGAAAEGELPPAVAGEAGRVLLADDNADLRLHVGRLLASRGYAVTLAGDGEAALAAARRERPDLLLTDVMMPVLDGFGLLAAVRADPALHDLPVIMVSARAGEEAQVEGLVGGADDYLAKPFSTRELLARVRANIEVARARREAAARVQASAEAQRISEERLRIAIEGAEAGVWDLDLARGEGFWSDRHFTILGLPARAAGDGDLALWQERVHPDDLDRVLESFRTAMQRGEHFRAEYRVIRADSGEVRWLAAFGRGVAGEGGTRSVGVVMDVTERKAAEAALQQLNESLENRVAAAVAAREAALADLSHLQRMEALGQLTGGIAHDFNNVLQAVQGGARLIENRATEPRVRELARLVSDAAERGASVTRRLLAFARRAELRASAVDAATLLAEMQEILSHTLGAGIAVQVRTVPELSPLQADKSQLETVLINLATNARDAMDGTGTLTLAAAMTTAPDSGVPARLRPGRYVCLSVNDTGAGMSPEVLARACEPFYTTKRPGDGTGLGLAMARGFAEQSGGALVIASAPGEGTTIRLFLPVAAAYAVPVVPAISVRADGNRVMLVDDENLVRDVLAEQLAAAGFAVLALDAATAALARLDAGEPVDVLVADLSMPEMDGLALIRAAQDRRPGLPAILLTGFVNEAAELAVGGAISGRFSLLRKPVSGEALAARIAMLVEGQAAA